VPGGARTRSRRARRDRTSTGGPAPRGASRPCL